jgi:putative aminopeptidase FrvX
MKVLKEMCHVHAPSGEELAMKEFLLSYIEKMQNTWAVQPEIVQGDDFQDCLMLKFGTPRTAIFAHMDSIGFTVKYGKQLVKIGGPRAQSGWNLVGQDSKGPIECQLSVIEDAPGKQPGELEYVFHREIDRGTSLTFKPDWREDDEYVQCCYMDNRLGMYNALKVAETMTDGVICFSCWEEHGAGAVGYLGRHIYEQWGVRQALISDITWITEGILFGEGVAISMRDSGIPRRTFVNKIIDIAKANKVPHQLEVESSGGSDGNQLQRSPYPFDWCFIGAGEDHVHSPNEKVNKADIAAMQQLYEVLMREL